MDKKKKLTHWTFRRLKIFVTSTTLSTKEKHSPEVGRACLQPMYLTGSQYPHYLEIPENQQQQPKKSKSNVMCECTNGEET